MKKAPVTEAWIAGIFKTLNEAEQHTCDCARVLYRNEHEGARSYRIKGDPGCQKCRGTGAIEVCSKCAGAGMLPGSQICSECRGTGKVPLARRAA